MKINRKKWDDYCVQIQNRYLRTIGHAPSATSISDRAGQMAIREGQGESDLIVVREWKNCIRQVVFDWFWVDGLTHLDDKLQRPGVLHELHGELAPADSPAPAVVEKINYPKAKPRQFDRIMSREQRAAYMERHPRLEMPRRARELLGDLATYMTNVFLDPHCIPDRPCGCLAFYPATPKWVVKMAKQRGWPDAEACEQCAQVYVEEVCKYLPHEQDQ